MDKVERIFESYVQNMLFKDKSVLQANHIPGALLHRGAQIESIASILAPALKGQKVSNLFLYGRTGSGKTVSVQHVGVRITEKIKKMGGGQLKFVYLNCKMKKVADTEYRIIAELIHLMGGKVAVTGLPTDVVYSKFVDMIDDQKQVIILVLDEIDQAVKKISDNFIYTLTRMNSELKYAQISLVGISNSLTFMDHLDPRVRSSLGEEEIVFPPYNALQLQDILRERAEHAFEKGALDEGVIAKCAAYAAREHGDARRAIDLLRVAGELAEREGVKKIHLSHIDQAKEKIERDKMLDVIESVPTQFQLVLGAIMKLDDTRDRRRKKGEMVDDRIFTGDVYTAYQEICEKTKNESLTQRRISDILAEFDMLGIINANVVSKGRQGRTREIRLKLASGIKDKARDILSKSFEM